MAKRLRKEYTRNDTLALMYESEAMSLNKIADHVEKWGYSSEEIIQLLRECADQQEAQSIVVDLRDQL